MRSIPPARRIVNLAALAADLQKAETTLTLLDGELDPAVAQDLRRRIALARVNLALLADSAALGGVTEKAPFWKEFAQDRPSPRAPDGLTDT